MKRPNFINPAKQCPYCFSKHVEAIYAECGGAYGEEDTGECRCIHCGKVWVREHVGTYPCPSCGRFDDREEWRNTDEFVSADNNTETCHCCGAEWPLYRPDQWRAAK